MNARVVVSVLALALCCAAAPVEPHLQVGAPWRPGRPVSNSGSRFTALALWVLSDGTPHPDTHILQYIWLTSAALDERGLGGYVADEVGSIQRTPGDSNLQYSQIDSCLRPAWVATYDVDAKFDSNGLQRSFERVYFAFRDTLYVMQYVRPFGKPLDPVAQAALLSFCTSVPGRG